MLHRDRSSDHSSFIYTAELCSLVTAHHQHPHQYADDVQTYSWRPPTKSNALQNQLSSCIQDVCRCMQSHRLQLNTSKMEFIWCCPSRHRRHLPDGDFHVKTDQVKPVSAARNLGVFMDSEMSMRSHMSHIAASCFSAMPQIHSIWDRYHPLRRRCSLPVLFTLG